MLYIKLVCIVSITAGVLMTVIPGGKLKGSFVSLCAVITVSAMVLPFKDADIADITAFDSVVTESSDSLNEKTRQAQKQIYESALASATQENLKNEGISADVSVYCEEYGDSFTVSAVNIKGDFTAEEISRINDILSVGFPSVEIVYQEAADG